MQALGFIETKGLLAAVEGADAMLKAAEVTLADKTYVGGGLVSIAVTGGVAAVKAAVEAGAAAVKQINESLLVSTHVIPRPHDEINSLIKPVNLTTQAQDMDTDAAGNSTAEDTDAVETEAEDTEATESEADDIEAEDTEATETEADDIEAEDITAETDTSEETFLKDISEEDAEIEAAESEAEAVEANVEKTEISETAEDYGSKETMLQDNIPEKISKNTIDKLVQEYGLEKALEVLDGLKVTKLRNLAREYKNLRIAGRVISKAGKKLLLEEFREYYKKN